MIENKRLIKNTGIIAIGNLSTKLVSFFLLPLYTTMLSTMEYGIVDYIVCISTFCVPFFSVLMDESMFRFLIDCHSEEDKAEVISLSLIINLFGIWLFLMAAVPILYNFKFKYSYYLIGHILTSDASLMISALLRGLGKTGKYALFNFLTSILNIILNILFISILKKGITGMLLSYILSQSSMSLVFIFNTRLWQYIKIRSINFKKSMKMVQYSIPLIPNKISWSIINLSDRLMIMNMIGSDASGLYAISYKFPTLMDTVYGFFYQSWKESSARVLENEYKDLFYNNVYKYLKNFMYSIVLGMIAFMPLIYYLLINDSYYKSIFYVPILLIGTYFSNISGFYGGIFTAYKDTKIMGITTMIAAIINIIINILFLKFIGIYAAAASTMLANFTVYLYRKSKVKRYVLLVEDYKRQILSILITGIILFFFYLQKPVLLGVGCILSIIYAIVINKKMIHIIFVKLLHKKWEV